MKPKVVAALIVSVLIASVALALSLSTGGGRDTAPVVNGPTVTVPAAAIATLQKIDAGKWPVAANAPGTKGGDTWRNQDRDLPTKDSAGKPISYQEWDVNPKQRGQSRDAERIITGSDGSAWYTGDHYRTFTRMR